VRRRSPDFHPGVSASFRSCSIACGSHGWLRTREWRWLPLCDVLGVLPGFKVYPGLLVMGALLAAGAWRWGFNRDWRLLLAWAAILPVFLAVFLPPNLGAPSLVRFLPGFNVASMLVAPDRMALMSSATLKRWTAQYPGDRLLLLLGMVFLAGNRACGCWAFCPWPRSCAAAQATRARSCLLLVLAPGRAPAFWRRACSGTPSSSFTTPGCSRPARRFGPVVVMRAWPALHLCCRLFFELGARA
jgi:hypothetical protein